MRQFLLPDTYEGQPELIFSGRDYHYLCRVRRIKTGDSIAGIDAGGKKYRLRMTAQDGKSCTLAIEGETAAAMREDIVPITLFQCLPKGRKLDTIIRQATEAGITRIIPVESERSIRKIDAADDGNKTERWKKIAREALQQSGTSRLPEIMNPVPFSRIPALRHHDDLGLFLYEEAVQTGSLHAYMAGRPAGVSYVVGPEGGLSEKETMFLIDNNFKPIFLGNTVLRTETAALFGLAGIKLLLLEIDSWKTT